MSAYLFAHEGKVYSPDGKVNVSAKEAGAINRAQDEEDLAYWQTKPDQFSPAYYVDNTDEVTTWYGTTLGKIYHRSRSRMPNGMRILHIRVQGTNGASYYGKLGDDWSQLVRLHKFR